MKPRLLLLRPLLILATLLPSLPCASAPQGRESAPRPSAPCSATTCFGAGREGSSLKQPKRKKKSEKKKKKRLLFRPPPLAALAFALVAAPPRWPRPACSSTPGSASPTPWPTPRTSARGTGSEASPPRAGAKWPPRPPSTGGTIPFRLPLLLRVFLLPLLLPLWGPPRRRSPTRHGRPAASSPGRTPSSGPRTAGGTAGGRPRSLLLLPRRASWARAPRGGGGRRALLWTSG